MNHPVKIKPFAALLAAFLISACAAPSPGITEAEVRSEYERIVARAFSGKEYAVRHVLVEKREQAVAALQRLKSGEPFAKVALEVSTDPRSSRKGGELGWSLPEYFTPKFSEAMVALAPTGISSEPVQTPFGWHIIEVTNVRNQEPPPFAQVKDQIAEKLWREKTR